MMSQSWQRWNGRVVVVSGLAIAEILLGSGEGAIAQVQPSQRPIADPTAGTRVEPVDATTDRIAGGRVSENGTNLFHSFSEFNVGNGRSVVFNAPGIETIFSRVTGGRESVINGRIESPANLFLLNPNGIILGENARLDIHGSFVASTANSVLFDNGFAFEAVNSPLPALLSINVPVGLQYGQQPGSIRVNGQLIADSGRSIVLAGGTITLDNNLIEAPGGRIDLLSIGGVGQVGFNPNTFGVQFPVSAQVARADVIVSNDALVNVAESGGGAINVVSRDLILSGGSNLLAGIDSDGTLTTQAGNIQIDATREIRLIEGSSIENSVFRESQGQAGDVVITASIVNLIGDTIRSTGEIKSSGIYSRVENAIGRSGQIEMTVETLTLAEGAVITTSLRGIGASGNIVINADIVRLLGQGRFSGEFRQTSGVFSGVTNAGNGQGGEIEITARELYLEDGGGIITDARGEGQAGNVTMTANRLVISGSGTQSEYAASGIYSRVDDDAISGQGGEILLRVDRMELNDEGIITADTQGNGRAGNITIEQASFISLDGQSQIAANTVTEGNAGNLLISTDRLRIQGGSRVSARTSSVGDAGTLQLTASESVLVVGRDSVLDFGTFDDRALDAGDATQAFIISTPLLEVRNGGRVEAVSLGAGEAGTLQLNVGRLVVRDRGQVTVNSQSREAVTSGGSGDLNITAGSIFLSDRGQLTAETAAGEGGNVNLQVENLILMRNESLISASAVDNANGGNVAIEIPDGFVLAILSENSDVVASAEQGDGGRAAANATGVFGFRQFRDRRTPESDFTASSELGIDGVLEIDTRDRELVEDLPTDIVRATIAQGCDVRRAGNQSEFVVTGRGGLPPIPADIVGSSTAHVDLVGRPETTSQSSSDYSTEFATSIDPIVEAQDWVIDRDGTVMLVAQASTATPHQSWQNSIACTN